MMEQCYKVGCVKKEQGKEGGCMICAISELRERFGISESRLIALALRIPEKRVREIVRLSAK